MRKRGFTAVELVVVIVVLAILMSITMVMVDRRRQAMLREDSAANLRTVYASIGQRISTGPFMGAPRVGWYTLSTTPGQLAPHPTDHWVRFYSEAEKAATFISPAHPLAQQMREEAHANPASALTDDSYWFFGFDLPNEEAGLAFVAAYRKSVTETGKPPVEQVLDVSPFFNPGTDQEIEHLLRLGANMFWASRIPVMVERPGLQRRGGNVLFTDGHIEFIEYPGKLPMTEKFIKALESLDALKEKR